MKGWPVTKKDLARAIAACSGIQQVQALAGDVAGAFARLDACGADAELIGLAKACLAPAPEARPADAAEVAGRVRRYRDEVAARQAQAERVLWLCHAPLEGGEAVPRPPRPPVRGCDSRPGGGT